MSLSASIEMQPMWSVMIPTYNSEVFLKETLESLLVQDLGPSAMQITVVDNGSTDGTEAIVQETGKGRIEFIRNDHNYGVMGNFNRCVELARGQYVHILNSDDTLLPGFYERYGQVLERHPTLGLLSSNSELMNEHSQRTGETPPFLGLETPGKNLDPFLYYNPVRTPAVVVSAEAYKRTGGFDTELLQVGDWDMWMRVIATCSGMHLNEILTRYRLHTGNETSRVYLTGDDLFDLERLYMRMEERGYGIDRKRYLKNLFRAAYNKAINLTLQASDYAERAWSVAKKYDIRYDDSLNFHQKLAHRTFKLLFFWGKLIKRKFLSAKIKP